MSDATAVLEEIRVAIKQAVAPDPYTRYTIAEAAERLKLSLRQVHERRRAGKIHFFRDEGSRQLFTLESELQRYNDACMSTPE